MKAEDIVKAAGAYKQSACLMAAVQMGLKKTLKNPRTLEQASKLLEMKEELLLLFFLYCESLGLLEERQGLWHMKENTYAALEDAEALIQYECTSMSKWNTPENICRALKGDRRKISAMDKQVYCKAMNGMGMKLAGLLIRRKFGKDSIHSLLDIGSSGGELGSIVTKGQKEVQKRSVLVGMAGSSEGLPWDRETEVDLQECYDIVQLYNAVHYFSEKELIRLFEWVHSHIHEKSLIAVADIFLSKDTFSRYAYLPDWITHGGTNNLYEDDILKAAENSGLDLVENRYESGISMNIIFLSKSKNKI